MARASSSPALPPRRRSTDPAATTRPHASIGRLRNERSPAASNSTPSFSRISRMRSLICAIGNRFKLNCKHRDNTVTGNFCGSVVRGGTSHAAGVLERLQKRVEECVESMCTSVDEVDAYSVPVWASTARCRAYSRVSSTLGAMPRRLDEIYKPPPVISRHAAANTAGSGGNASFAIEALRKNSRDRRLATPRVPVNRNACALARTRAHSPARAGHAPAQPARRMI